MANCGGWYYAKPPWHKDALIAVTGTSGLLSKSSLTELAETNDDARIFNAYLKALHQGNERDPFGCAEPHAVHLLIEKKAQLNQIFIGNTTHMVDLTTERTKWLKPCENCQKWLTPQLKDGSYMLDMAELNRFVKDSKLSWWTTKGDLVVATSS